MEAAYDNGAAYISKSFALGEVGGVAIAWVGIVLWITTIGLSGALIDNKTDYQAPGPHDQDYYIAVVVCTVLAGIFTAIDYKEDEPNWSTIATVFLGSVATFLSLGLWAIDTQKKISTALLFVQMAANAIQLAAIFNHSRTPVGKIKSANVSARPLLGNL